jgi:hypothetical protein
MRTTPRRHVTPLVLIGLTLLASCTASRRPMLNLSRLADTLTVALDPATSARWSSNQDWLLVECNACADGASKVEERFFERNYARYEISRSQEIKLSLFWNGKLDTTIIVAGTGEMNPQTDRGGFKPLPPLRRTRRAVSDESPSASNSKNAPEKKVVKKGPASLRVSAAEGIAVYSDKSKTQVLKILPKGTVLPLLSREGDMYAVMVGDVEGFVESEAVQVVP